MSPKEPRGGGSVRSSAALERAFMWRGALCWRSNMMPHRGSARNRSAVFSARAVEPQWPKAVLGAHPERAPNLG
jgi:hypothetical protein